MVVISPSITNKVTFSIGLANTNCSYYMLITTGNLNNGMSMEIPNG
jgi:hypothetical protein